MDPFLVAAILNTISCMIIYALLWLLAAFAMLSILPRVSPSLKFLFMIAVIDLFFFGFSSSVWLSITFFKPLASATVILPYTEFMTRIAIPVTAFTAMSLFANAVTRSVVHDPLCASDNETKIR